MSKGRTNIAFFCVLFIILQPLDWYVKFGELKNVWVKLYYC